MSQGLQDGRRPDRGAPVADPGEGGAALRAAVTARIAEIRTSRVHRQPAATASDHAAKASAVHRWSGRLESAGHTGGAVLPWVILGGSLLAVVAGIMWVLMR